MKEIHVGLVGCGAVAPTHLYSYKGIEGCKVVAVCDLQLAKAQKLAAMFGIPKAVSDFSQLLDDGDIDLIDICTDHASHSPLAVRALEAGKNVVCEKCLANNLANLDAMLAAHRNYPELVFSGIFQHRHERANLVLKRLFDEGAFGTLMNASVFMCCLRPNSYYDDYWHGKWDGEGGSLLITQVIHFIDLVNYFMGEPESVMALGGNLMHQGVIETEDNAGALVRYPNGVLCTISANSASAIDHNIRAAISIGGTKGHLELSAFKPAFYHFHDPRAQQTMEELMATFTEETPPDPNKPHYGGGHPAQLADVVAAVREQRPPLVTAEKASVTARLILSCYESMKTGKWISLK